METTRPLGAIDDVRCGMLDEPTGGWELYNRWTICSLNLIGDPEMPVWIPLPPRLRLCFPELIRKRFPFPVEVIQQVGDQLVPLEDGMVHLRQGGFSPVAR